MTQEATPTPRVDERAATHAKHSLQFSDREAYKEMCRLARTLEMENAALRKALDREQLDAESIRMLFRKATGYTVEGYKEMEEEVRNER